MRLDRRTPAWARTFPRLAALVALTLMMTMLGAVPATAGAGDPAPPAAAASRAARATQAHLQVLTPAQHVRERVRFGLSGTRIRPGRHLRSLRVNFGDGHHHSFGKVPRRFVHRYRKAGAYVVRLRIVDSRGRHDTSRRTVVVSRPDRVKLRSTVQKVSQESLLAVTPLSPTQEVLTLRPGTQVPTVGRTLLVPAGTLTPIGLIAVVDGVAMNTDGPIQVSAHDGQLKDVYAKLRTASTIKPGSSVALGRYGRPARQLRMSAVPFVCSSGTAASVSVVADLRRTEISAVFNLAARIFSFNITSKPSVTLNGTLSGAAECKLKGGFALNFPVPSVPGLVVSVSPYFNLSGTGALSASATWSPVFLLNIARTPDYDDNTLVFRSKATSEASGNASISVEGGLAATVSVGKLVGLTATVGPRITVEASASATASCVHASAAIEASISLQAGLGAISASATLFSGEYLKSPLVDKCVQNPGGAGGSGDGGWSESDGGGPVTPGAPPYTGPSTPETTGSVAHTWTDYVHAGGQQGPDLAANATYGVVCKIIGFTVADGNSWWYRISSAPWNGVFYASADSFYNNGQTSGTLKGTPFVDPAVPDCTTSAGSLPVGETPPVVPNPGNADGTFTETTGSVTHTWTNYTNAGGTEGPTIPSNTSVQIRCKVVGFKVANGNVWWYRIASSPWSDTFYASADAFYNNGQTSGSLTGTPYVDSVVPDCNSQIPGQTWTETTGSVTHTWSNYTNAGGTQGPTIAAFTSVQIRCKVVGFQVANGNTWWYRIASSPWSDTFYASADAFYNNGQTSGPLAGTPYVDPAVADC